MVSFSVVCLISLTPRFIFFARVLSRDTISGLGGGEILHLNLVVVNLSEVSRAMGLESQGFREGLDDALYWLLSDGNADEV